MSERDLKVIVLSTVSSELIKVISILVIEKAIFDTRVALTYDKQDMQSKP